MVQAGGHSRHRYDPSSMEPFAVSRSKLELFLECARCFYLDRRHGVGRPDGMSFTLNLAVDTLLKKEFDAHRVKGEPHPLMSTYGVEAVPFRHPQFSEWRDSPKGMRAVDKASNIELFGIVDDVWVEPDGSLIVVDYKATSVGGGVHVGDLPRPSYERQLEVYQWLLRKNGFKVSSTGYLVYVNADRERAAFDKRLEFSAHLVQHEGDGAWIDDALAEVRRCLDGELPTWNDACKWCAYRKAARDVE